MFYVYEWFIVETGEVIYVGKGCRLRYRVRKHNKFFNDMVNRYNCESRIIKTFESEVDAFAYEYQRVKELKEEGQCVCNIYNGGCGGTTSWWTDELKERYSLNNVMKSERQRARMRNNNPMKTPSVAQKTNGRKRRTVSIGDKTFSSIKDAREFFNASYHDVISWCKKGVAPNGDVCTIEPQKQYWHKHKAQGNQQPSRGKSDNSTTEGSTTNE